MSENELALEYEYLRQEIEEIDREIKELQSHQSILLTTLETIEKLRTAQDRKALIPLGGGVYTHAITKDTSSVLVNVGANVLIEMPVKKAEKIINERIDQITSMIVKLNDEANEFLKRMQEIEIELSKIKK